jgi:ATP-dependent HslUV protease ATP-binding subunit HslU
VRDLVEIAVHAAREKQRATLLPKAEIAAEERVIDALVGEAASESSRQTFRKKLRENELNDREIEIELRDGPGGPKMPSFEIPGMPGAQMGVMNLNDIFGKAFQAPTKKRRMTVGESYEALVREESEALVDEDAAAREAVEAVEENGIVFLDEIDKIASAANRSGADVSREGVQRDLLPLIEGATVPTKYGTVKTDHILFIASGAFHLAKPSDLLPELQGRLPIRVELKALERDDFVRILREPEASLLVQYKALMETEGVTLDFTDDAIEALADLTAEINASVENIGARRLHTVMERLLEEISFDASDRKGESIKIDGEMVRDRVGELAKDTDLSKFIL